MKAIVFFVLLFGSLNLFAALQPEMLDKNIGIVKLSDKAYLLESSYHCSGNLDCNHLLILDEKDLVLVNTPYNDSLTDIMLNCIERKFHRKVTKVVVSHFHDDSSGGLAEIRTKGIKSYGLVKTKELLGQAGNNLDEVFSDSLKIPLQTRTIELYFFGAGHSVDNIVTWVPEEKILFGGCLIKSLSAQNKGNIKDADLRAWPITVAKVKARFSDAIVVIPGHSESGDASLLDHTLELVKE